MKIALAAYKFINNDLDFNISQIEKAMRALQGKADLVCFGETFLQGFDSLNWSYEHDKEIAIAKDSETMQRLCNMTQQYKVDLLFGYIERSEGSLYSSCAVIADGMLVHNYRRISKGWKEFRRTDNHYKEGSDTGEFIYKGQAIKIALCGDMWDYPESFKTNHLLIWPVYVNFGLEEWKQYEQEYAQQAKLAASHTLMINSLSDDPKSYGGAFYYVNGKIEKQLPYGVEDMMIVNIDA